MERISFLWLSPFITRVGKKLGIDAHYFAKSSAIVTASHGVGVLKGLVTGYLVTRMFPQEMYGQYQFVLTVVGVIGAFGLSSLPSAVGRSIARKEETPLRFTMSRYAAFCALGSAVLLGIAAVMPLLGRTELWPLFVVAALLFVPQSVAVPFFGGIVMGTSRFGVSLRAAVLSSAIVTVGVLVMLFTKPSALLLLAIVTGVPSLVYLWLLTRMLREFPSKKKSWDILRYSWNLTVANIPFSLSWYVDKLLVSAFFGLNQLALLSVALLIPEQVKVWTKELIPITFAKQAGGEDSPERRAKLLKMVGLLTLAFAAGIACYIAVTPWIMPILFPRYDADMTRLVLLTNIAAATLVTAPATLFPQYLEARGMIREIRISNVVTSIAFLVALVTLVPKYGPLGAVIARGVFRLCFVSGPLLFLLGKPAMPGKPENQGSGSF
jgi:O-antigen/teichoic acid export membrane protein